MIHILSVTLPLDNLKVRKFPLHVVALYAAPPGPPQLSGYHVGQPVRANETVELVCRSTGGNPLGSLVWYRGDGRVDSSFTSGAGTAVNRHSFVAAATDDGAVYRCDVSNLVTPSPLSASLTLQVLCECDLRCPSFLAHGDLSSEGATGVSD